MNLSPDIITKDCRPMTPGERMRVYLERREYAMGAGHGVSCEVVAQPNNTETVWIHNSVNLPGNAIITFLRKGGAK